MTSTRAGACVALLTILAAPAAAKGGPDYRQPDRNWVKGPVKWLLTKPEIKAFKKLGTDEERAAFVRAFWEQRDPTPGTPKNEYEEIFWKRVEEADRKYRSITRAGSLTDMGRVFLLLGPPSGVDTDSRGYRTWRYEPSEISGIKEAIELRFGPNPTGMLLLDRKVLDSYVAAHQEARGIGWKLPPIAGAGDLQIPSAQVARHIEDRSPESQRQIPILEGVLDQGGGPSDVPFEVAFGHYKTADASTLLVITVEVPREAAHGAGETALLPFARLEPAAGDGPAMNITGGMPFRPAPGGDHPPESFIYQTRRNVAPGTYRVAVVVEDKVIRGTMGARVLTVEVPDHSGTELSASSVALLWKFDRVEPEPAPDEGAERPGPYVLGSFRLVPRAIPSLGEEEQVLAYYYQVYNPATDPTSGDYDLEVTYRFRLKRDGEWKPFGKPLVSPLRQVELYAIDLTNLRVPNLPLPAEFRLDIGILDKISGERLERELRFTVH
ncbi:MAG: GWxTD domain-containing protein [Acidobacteriota bacterium]